jgi:hypothetical protein
MTERLVWNPSAGVDNDGRFPDDAVVAVRFPLEGDDPARRESWSWAPGMILAQCGPDEWHVQVQVRELATTDDLGRIPAPPGADEDELYYPGCFRDASELEHVAQAVSR